MSNKHEITFDSDSDNDIDEEIPINNTISENKETKEENDIAEIGKLFKNKSKNDLINMFQKLGGNNFIKNNTTNSIKDRLRKKLEERNVGDKQLENKDISNNENIPKKKKTRRGGKKKKSNVN